MKGKANTNITYEKLYADLLEVNDEIRDDIKYFENAIDFLEKLESGEVDHTLLAAIRTESCLDRNHLKGDYFRSVYKILSII